LLNNKKKIGEQGRTGLGERGWEAVGRNVKNNVDTCE
jgi:hypothetical protein